MPNNRDLSKKPSCITNKNKGKSNVPEELAALVFNMFWPTKQTKGKMSRYPESQLLGYNMLQPTKQTNQKNVQVPKELVIDMLRKTKMGNYYKVI